MCGKIPLDLVQCRRECMRTPDSARQPAPEERLSNAGSDRKVGPCGRENQPGARGGSGEGLGMIRWSRSGLRATGASESTPSASPDRATEREGPACRDGADRATGTDRGDKGNRPPKRKLRRAIELFEPKVNARGSINGGSSPHGVAPRGGRRACLVSPLGALPFFPKQRRVNAAAEAQASAAVDVDPPRLAWSAVDNARSRQRRSRERCGARRRAQTASSHQSL